jgi:hypothetical protein
MDSLPALMTKYLEAPRTPWWGKLRRRLVVRSRWSACVTALVQLRMVNVGASLATKTLTGAPP